jgi:hypothetical protein
VKTVWGFRAVGGVYSSFKASMSSMSYDETTALGGALSFLGIEDRLADVRYQRKRTSMVVINMKQGVEA